MGSIEVKFYDEYFPQGLTYQIDVPVEEGSFITGDKLSTHIMTFAPYGQLERAKNTKDVSSKELELLTTPSVPNIKNEIKKTRIEKLLGSVAYKGNSYHVDSGFQQVLTTFLSISKKGPLTVRTYTDDFVDLTATEVKELLAKIFEYSQSVYSESWEAKDKL
jgi:hypothetical protein